MPEKKPRLSANRLSNNWALKRKLKRWALSELTFQKIKTVSKKDKNSHRKRMKL